jgi:hypothetical protein
MRGQPPSTVRPGQKPGGCRCRRVRPLGAYKDFLTLWKDADPDIPILKEAQASKALLPLFSNFRHSTEAAHRLDVDAKEHRLNRQIVDLFAPFCQRI